MSSDALSNRESMLQTGSCITTTEAFQTNVLNADILSIAIVSRSDVYADDPEYSPASYRKAS